MPMTDATPVAVLADDQAAGLAAPDPQLMQRLQDVPVSDDVLAYTLDCLRALAPRTSAAALVAVERQVRDTFGGDEVWLADGAAQLRRVRDAKIKHDYLRGERLELLQRRYQLSRRRLFQIVKS